MPKKGKAEKKVEDPNKLTVRRVGKVLDIGNRPIFWDIKLSLIDERVGLEKLWPGCTVYWDTNPRLVRDWRNYYIKLKVVGEYPYRDSFDDTVLLMAYKTDDDGRLELVQSDNAIIKNQYVGAPIKAEYTIDDEGIGHWVIFR